MLAVDSESRWCEEPVHGATTSLFKGRRSTVLASAKEESGDDARPRLIREDERLLDGVRHAENALGFRVQLFL